MPICNTENFQAAIALDDTPLVNTSALGPDTSFHLRYFNRGITPPASMAYANVGPVWTHNWSGFVTDDPLAVGQAVQVRTRSGIVQNFSGYNVGSGSFNRDLTTRAQLVITSTNPIRYERRFTDGSMEVYARSNGAAASPRMVFLTQIVDAQRNSVTLNYDAQNRVQSLTDAVGRTTTFAYEVATNPYLITKVQDPFGRKAVLTYDSAGRLQSITDVIGLTTTLAYSGVDIVSMTTPYGTTTFEQGQADSHWWLVTTDPMGFKERNEFMHGAPGIPFSEAQAPANVTSFNAYLNYRDSYLWDKSTMAAMGANLDYTKAHIRHLLHATSGSVSNVLESEKRPLEGRIWYYYPGQSNPTVSNGISTPELVARVMPDGSTQNKRQTYTETGFVQSQTDPLGRMTSYEYAPNGIDLIAIKQAVAGAPQTLAAYTYNSQHQPLSYTNAAGKTTTYTYTAQGKLASTKNPLGDIATYTYDALGQLIKVTGPDGRIATACTYDPEGRIASQTDSEGYTVRYAYDALNRLTQTSYPDTTSEKYTWTKLDLTASTDRAGKTTIFTYDANRRLTQVTDPLGRTTRYGYNPNGELTSLTDGKGQTTRWVRDLQGRVVSKTYPSGSTTTYAYDAVGRLQSSTDPAGNTQTTQFAQDDRPSGWSVSGNSVAPVTLTWDASYPRLNSVKDASGTTLYTWAPAGSQGANHIASITTVAGKVSYTYDALDRISSRSINDQHTKRYTRDKLGRITQETNTLGSFDYSYLGSSGQVAAEQLTGQPWGTKFSYEPNLKNRSLAQIDFALRSTGQHDDDEGDDDDDRQPRSLTPWWLPQWLAPRHGHGNGKHPANAQASIHYQTNPLGQITQKTQGRTATNYRYDSAGRLVGASPSQGNGPQQYTYDLADNLTQINDETGTQNFGLTPDNTIASTPWQYDTSGNVLKDNKARSYRWDGLSRLTRIGYAGDSPTSPQATEFTRDAWGRMVVIQEKGSKPSTERLIWCEGALPCARADAQGKVLTVYERQGEKRLDASSAAAQSQYYARDHLGSVLALVDAKGQEQARQSYTAYGAVTSKTGAAMTVGYAGMWQHNRSGLNLTWYRPYDAASARWLSKDPMEEAGGLNVFAYVNQDPVNGVDPLGLKPGDRYKTRTGAAIQAIKDINSISIKNGVEYAGRIYQNKDGSYSYTKPIRGTKDGSNPGSCPIGTVNEGTYHTHGSADPGYDNENFSGGTGMPFGDIGFYKNEGLPGYLGTPNGDVKFYDPHSISPFNPSLISRGVK